MRRVKVRFRERIPFVVKRVYSTPLTIAGEGRFKRPPHREVLPESLTFAQSAWQRGSRRGLAYGDNGPF
jgi:hypothetical protein